MSDTHILTDKETKAIADAISVIKKFGKYIERVNTTNWSLQDNLDKAIKAGDVTLNLRERCRIFSSAYESQNVSLLVIAHIIAY